MATTNSPAVILLQMAESVQLAKDKLDSLCLDNCSDLRSNLSSSLYYIITLYDEVSK
ncbi:MAG: hypothetical protein RR086_03605 [Clostridia bacterium]